MNRTNDSIAALTPASAVAEGLSADKAELLANLAYETRMAARAADYLATDLLGAQVPGEDGPRVIVRAAHADLLMHAVDRTRTCIEALEDAIEAIQFGSHKGAAQ